MRFPKFLAPGGRVGFIAPSFGCDGEPYATGFNAAQAYLSSLGYETVEGPNCRAGLGTGKSNTPELCGAEINDFFLNGRADAIISCGGGETMCEDLGFVDFEGIAAAEPRWFMGFSDNTNLTFTLPTLCDTAAVYGPCAATFGMSPRHPAVDDALALLEGRKLSVRSYDGWERVSLKSEDSPTAPWNITEPFELKVFAPDGGADAAFSGRLLGGCLDILSILCGTRFDRVADFNRRYGAEGVVWFFEACDLNPMGIRRALWQLDAAGWFENAAGFLVGRAFDYDAQLMGMDRLNAVTGLLGRYNVPILLDADLGHLPPMMPLICGASADVRAAGGELFIDMKTE